MFVILRRILRSQFYFKKPDPRYPWEFWCEIAASRIGELLKFDVADYHIAINKQGDVGCISRSIIPPRAELIHGQQFLLRIKPDFEVKYGSDHSFQLVEKFFLSKTPLKILFRPFISMLVFDAIVGNHDRHQQNWAILRTINLPLLIQKKGVRKAIEAVVKMIGDKKNPDEGIEEPGIEINFSKIFDSGNCLAYNYADEKIVNDLLNNEAKFEDYVNGNLAVGHLRWNGIKLKYVDLLLKIKEKYPEEINAGVKHVVSHFDMQKVASIINNLDSNFPADQFDQKYNLSSYRKSAMIKLLKARFELFKPLID